MGPLVLPVLSHASRLRLRRAGRPVIGSSICEACVRYVVRSDGQAAARAMSMSRRDSWTIR